MRLKDFISVVEEGAPKSLARDWDNPGLIIEPDVGEITRVLVALDCTPDIVLEAQSRGAQLVLTHHPILFKPVRRLSYNDPQTAVACMLLRRGIGLYAAHTNLDSAINGVNDALAGRLGLYDICAFAQAESDDCGLVGLGRIGFLKKTMPLKDFALFVRDALSAPVRYGGGANTPVRRVAVIGGSGGSFIMEAKAAGADVLVTGELKHDAALDAGIIGIGLVEAGHYQTERVVLEPWIAGLHEALKALQYSVDLLTAQNEGPPLIAL